MPTNSDLDESGNFGAPRNGRSRRTYAIALHGGAGPSPEMYSLDENHIRRKSLAEALETGRLILTEGGTSLNAVEAVVRYLEDNPLFNAGKGAAFNSDGQHELDAAIMDGHQRACGAIAGVRRIKNPISLARLVMEQTRHVFLSGAGAEQFAKQVDAEFVPNDYFSTEAKLQALHWARQRSAELAATSQQLPMEEYLGTVGCVALDRFGDLAAGTSTGGLTDKKFGRIGDSPLIGAGTFADNGTCAISCTGVGEQFIRHVVAYEISSLIAYRDLALEEAVQLVVHQKLNPGDGGLIAVSPTGEISIEFNTKGMARAAADSTGRFEIGWDFEGMDPEGPPV